MGSLVISDLAGVDIQGHDGEPLQALRATRDWLANVSRRQLPSANRLSKIYEKFCGDLPILAEALEFQIANIPYVDFETIVATWLITAPAT